MPGAAVREIRYRDVAASDARELRELTRLIERVFRDELDVPVAETLAEEIDASLRGEGLDLWVATLGEGKAVGALVARRQAVDRGTPGITLSWLVVDPAARGRGIASELLSRATAELEAGAGGVVRCRSFALSPAGPRLFWRHGFRVVDIVPGVLGGQKREVLVFERRSAPCGEAAPC